MTAIDATVAVFAMFFVTIIIKIASHQYIEFERMRTGFYRDNESTETKPNLEEGS
jgi:hypothetical protein